jgi:hypothetical protein
MAGMTRPAINADHVHTFRSGTRGMRRSTVSAYGGTLPAGSFIPLDAYD